MIYKLYNGEVELVFSEDSHRYKVDGEFKQGTTTILSSVTPKDGLIVWATNLAVDTFKKEIIKQGLENIDEIAELAKKAPNSKRDKGGDIGSIVHELIETYIKAKISQANTITLKHPQKPVQHALDAFLQWDMEYKPEYLKSEQPVYSRKLDYCGTADCIAKIGGKLTMIDFKTANPEIDFRTGIAHPYPKDFLQCAAYDLAHTEEFGVPCEQYMLVYITKTGKLYVFTSDEVAENIEAWRCALTLSRRVEKLKKDYISVLT
jgi:hypothetical protein